MAPNESGSPTRGRHSKQAVRERIAREEALLAEERQYAREAFQAAQERGEITIPRAKKSHKGIVILLLLLALALAAFFGRSYIAEFAHSHGLNIPFLTAQSAEDQSPATSSASSSASADASTSTKPANAGPFDIAQADFSAIPKTTAFGGFSLNPNTDAPIPSATAREAIQHAFEDIEAMGPCSFVFLDMKSGRGISYNAGAEFASSGAFDALYAYYLMDNAEKGALLSDDDRANLEAALVESNSGAYEALHHSHDTQDYNNWLAAHGVANIPEGSFSPNVSAATMAHLWLELSQYLNSGSDEANQLKELLERTDGSFIRAGLDGTGSQAWTKGGQADGEGAMALNDAGTIEADDSTFYLMVVLTEQDGSDEAKERAATLARALYDARSALA